MKIKTKWKKWNGNPLVGKRLFNDDYGFFKITKVQTCKEYCKCAETPSGSHWFDKKRAFIKTETGLKYIVPYLTLIINSVDEKRKMVAR